MLLNGFTQHLFWNLKIGVLSSLERIQTFQYQLSFNINDLPTRSIARVLAGTYKMSYADTPTLYTEIEPTTAPECVDT